MKWKNKEYCSKNPSDPLYIFWISDGSTASRKQIYWTLQYDIALCEEMINAWRGNCSDWKVIASTLTRRLKPHKPIKEKGCRDRFRVIREKNRCNWKRWALKLSRLVCGQCKGFVECAFYTWYSQISNAHCALLHPNVLLNFNQPGAVYQSSQELHLATSELVNVTIWAKLQFLARYLHAFQLIQVLGSGKAKLSLSFRPTLAPLAIPKLNIHIKKIFCLQLDSSQQPCSKLHVFGLCVVVGLPMSNCQNGTVTKLKVH